MLPDAQSTYATLLIVLCGFTFFGGLKEGEGNIKLKYLTKKLIDYDLWFYSSTREPDGFCKL